MSDFRGTFWQSPAGQAASKSLCAWAAWIQQDTVTEFDSPGSRNGSPSDISGWQAEYLQVETELGRNREADYLRPLLLHVWVNSGEISEFRPQRYDDAKAIARLLGVSPSSLFSLAHTSFARRLAHSIRDSDKKKSALPT